MKKNLIVKKAVSLLLAAFFAVGLLTACNSNSGANKLIGVCMPKKDVDRWLKDGDHIKKQLETKGYKVMLEYAEDDAQKQITQIESMIDARCKALIIAATDCYALNDVLKKASENKIKIISYDRMLMDTEYVDYYCTFDQTLIGEEQGKCIEKELKLAEYDVPPVYMEIFSGAADDSTSPELYSGQMSILQKYIDKGRLVIKSGEKEFDSTAIKDWDTQNAKDRMTGLLKNHYHDGTKLDAVLSANDSMALGVIEALKEDGYGQESKPFPVLTGQDGDKESVKALKAGEQTMTLFIDVRALAAKVVEMVDDLMLGKTPVIDDTTKYNNNQKTIPTTICMPIYVDKDNYYDVLVKEGFYKEEELR